MSERRVPTYREAQEAELEYTQDCISRIQKGELVWMQRNSDASFGHVVDFFSGGRIRGFVDADDDLTADAYLYVPVEGNPKASIATSINDEPVDFYAAQVLLEQAVAAVDIVI